MTADKIPFIGQYASDHPNWYVATGFQKWGMTGAMVSAMVLSDMVQENILNILGFFSGHGSSIPCFYHHDLVYGEAPHRPHRPFTVGSVCVGRPDVGINGVLSPVGRLHAREHL